MKDQVGEVFFALALLAMAFRGCDSCEAEDAREDYRQCVEDGFTAETCVPLMGCKVGVRHE